MSAAATTMATPMLELRGVSSGYGQATILRNVDLAVPAGSVTALLGPNGAGKTTLLATASGLIRPQKGSVLLDGVDVSRSSSSRRCEMGICHIPEGRAVFRSLTVKENLRLQAAKDDEQTTAPRVVEAFPILGKRMSQVAGTLSGGEQQMLAMAAAYARSPRLVMVDEASLGLAPIIVDAIFGFLEGLRDRGTSLLLVDQFIVRALALADRAYVIGKGEIVFAGRPDELRESDVFQKYLGNE
jgi:branched-chain amino acid transport system ATP-binding protein